MTVFHVIEGFPKASGVTSFVENVMREQRALGIRVEAWTLSRPVDQGSPKPDLVHIHGLWSPFLHQAGVWAKQNGVPVVWSTHGMTAPWSMRHKRWKKLPAWWLYQKRDLKRAALIHCTVEKEAEWNRALGFKRTCVVPLGTVLPEDTTDQFHSTTTTTNYNSNHKTLLFVGRIYPVKALDNVVRAAALMKQTVRFRIVGPDQAGHLAELEKLAVELGVRDRFDFAGPTFDAELAAEYDACDGLILVSHTENFGATVVDAMAHGKPVITSTKSQWPVVHTRCGWWVDNAPDVLAKTFDEFASASDEKLAELGRNGRALVEREYTWPVVAKKMVDEYGRVLGRRE